MPRTPQEFTRIQTDFRIIREKSTPAYVQVVKFFAKNQKFCYQSFNIIEESRELKVSYTSETSFGTTQGSTFYGTKELPAHEEEPNLWSETREILPISGTVYSDTNGFYDVISDTLILDASASLLRIILNGGFTKSETRIFSPESEIGEVDYDPFSLARATDPEHIDRSLSSLTISECLNNLTALSNHFDRDNLLTPNMVELLSSDIDVGRKFNTVHLRTNLFFLRSLACFVRLISSSQISENTAAITRNAYIELLVAITQVVSEKPSDVSTTPSRIETSDFCLNDLFFVDDCFVLRFTQLSSRLFSENEDNRVSWTIIRRILWLSEKFYLSLISQETRPKIL